MGVEAATDIATFIEIYNDTENYPSIADVAEATGTSIKTVRNKASMLRSVAKSDPAAPKLILRSPTSEIPLSEDASKFMEHWGRTTALLSCVGSRRSTWRRW